MILVSCYLAALLRLHPPLAHHTFDPGYLYIYLHSASEVRTFYSLRKGSTKGVVDASHVEIAAALIVSVAVAVVVVHVVVIRL